MRKTLALLLSLVMVITTLSVLPLTANAASDNGLIVFRDEFGAWGIDNYDVNDIIDAVFYQGANVEGVTGERVTSYNGISYNASTNTLSLNNAKKATNAFFVQISNMGDLTVNLTGTSAIVQLMVENTNITFKGTGTLNLNPKMSWSRYSNAEVHTNENILDRPVSCNASKLSITGSATLNVYNSTADESTMEFMSREPVAAANRTSAFLSYGKVSSTPAWDSWEEVNHVYDSVPYILHTVPGNQIMYRVGSTDANNYWIKSRMDYKNSTEYTVSPLVKNADGLWVEDYNHSYHLDSDGKYYARTVQNNWYDYDNPLDMAFDCYTDLDSLPAEKTDDGMLDVLVSTAYPKTSYSTCTRDGMTFAFRYSSNADWYNAAVSPSRPLEPAVKKGNDMFCIRTTGNTKYLEYCEHLNDSYISDEDLDAIVEGKGYEILKSITYHYYLLNSPTVTFNGGTPSHTHSYSWVVTKAATCTATGTKQYKCSCGNVSRTETIAALGHKPVTDKAVAATCTENGKTAGSHCSVCGAVITAQKTVEAKGHSYDDGKITKTTSTTYTKTFTCKTCKEKKKETFKKAANSLTVKGGKKTYKAKVLALGNKTLDGKVAFGVKGGEGTLKYKVVSKKKCFSCSSKGKLKIKKGTKPGKYTIKVKITAKGDDTHKSKTKSAVFTLTVK